MREQPLGRRRWNFVPYRFATEEVSDDLELTRADIQRVEARVDQLREFLNSSKTLSPDEERNLRQQIQDAWEEGKVRTDQLRDLHKLRFRRDRELFERAIVLGSEVQRLVRSAHSAARAELEMPPLSSHFDAAIAELEDTFTTKAKHTLAAFEPKTK